MITNDARCTRGIKSRVAVEKAVFNRQKTRKLDLNLRKKLIKFYTWSIILYGAETWILHVFHQPRFWFYSSLAEKYHNFCRFI